MNDINTPIPASTDLNTLEAAGIYKPFFEELSNTPVILISDEQKARISNAFDRLGEAFKSLGQCIRIAAYNINEFYMKILINSYPDKKIVHLALHSKKARVRKKNRNRILRNLKR